jgi:peroxiredoxin
LLDPSAAAEEPAPAEPRGLKIGAKAPAVKLPDLDGKQVDLEELRTLLTALLFWNPGCGFCQRLLPDLKTWESEQPKGAPKLVLISTGTSEANREHGLESTILLDQGFRTGEQFGASGTPSAIVLDEKGNVASGLAVGGPDVMKLLRP